MSIASEITSIGENLKKDYQSIANLGADLTNVDKNIENIAELLDGVYDNLPKTEYQEGTEVNLGVTTKGKLDFAKEYQEVEYIESTGTQYIDTGILPNSNQKIEIKLAWLNLGNNFAIGSRTSGAYNTSTDQIFLNYNSELTGIPNKALFVEGPYLGDSRDIIGSEISLGVPQIYTLNANKYQLTQTNKNYYIFCLNNIGTLTGVTSMRLYSCKIYDNETLVRDFIPCYRISDNVIGLYDKVEGKFYTNAGTGTFTKGADVGNEFGDIVGIGQTEQDGTPTPSTPIAIQCVTGNQDVVVSGKNLAHIEVEGKYRQASNGNFATNSSFNSYISSVKPNTSYIASCKNIATYYTEISNLCFFDVNMNFISGNNYNTSNKAFTTPNNCYYVTIAVNVSIEELQIEQGSTATTYEPYITPTSYQLSLGDIELAQIGTYKDKIYSSGGKWYLHKEVEKKEITSSSSIVYDTSFASVSRFRTMINNVVNATDSGKAYCNYFTLVDGYSLDSEHFYIYGTANNKNMFFFIDNDIASNLSELQTWLANKTIKVYYILIIPQDIEITDTTLIEQLNTWYNAHSNNGTTIITSNGNLPMIIKVRGLKGE